MKRGLQSESKSNPDETRAVTKCDLIPPPAFLTETSILYTDGRTDKQTHGLTHRQTDRQSDSSIPQKTFVLRGCNDYHQSNRPIRGFEPVISRAASGGGFFFHLSN